MIHEISAHEIVKILCSYSSRQKYALIDVRSPGEFSCGSISNFSNIPILNNSERAQVGTCYKQQGRSQAISLGHALVDPNKNLLIKSWAQEILNSTKKQAITMCWRGGLRSRIARTWLQESGYEALSISGGYKLVRKTLCEKFSSAHKLLIINGLTGSGKTELLQKFKNNSIDLESLAQHSGSAFGKPLGKTQPTQQNFENALGLELLKKQSKKLILEDESRLIGRCAIPIELFTQIKKAPRIILETNITQRIDKIITHYVIFPLEQGYDINQVRDFLCQATQKISKKLGGLLSQKIQKLIISINHDNFLTHNYHYDWVRLLLENYYDKAYGYSFKKHPKNIIFSGDFKSCYEFLQEYIIHD